MPSSLNLAARISLVAEVFSQQRSFHQIRFGTDGWRAIIAKEFTQDNLYLFCLGFSIYILENYPASRPVVIGYDARFMADRFAGVSSDILNYLGVPTLICKGHHPTPIVAHATLGGSAGALMFTASHNPPEYMGIKYIPEYAGPATLEITNSLLACIDRVALYLQEQDINIYGLASRSLAELRSITEALCSKTHSASGSQEIDPYPAYLERLKSIIDFDAIQQANHKQQHTIIYDPMYGAGRGFGDRVLKEAGFKVISLHDIQDYAFGGSLPEPLEIHLSELKTSVVQHKALLGVANDGDADRFAIIAGASDGGLFLSANQSLSIILKYLLDKYCSEQAEGERNAATHDLPDSDFLQNRQEQGLRARGGGVYCSVNEQAEGERNAAIGDLARSLVVARTVVTTHLIDELANKYQIPCVETPVGFKWLAAIMRERPTLMSCEESGGMSVLGHIPEKDGLLAILMMAEVLINTGKSALTLWEEVQNFVGQHYYYHRLDLHLDGDAKTRFMTSFQSNEVQNIAGYPITKRDQTEGIKLYLANGAWVLARPSGTEAMCRVYIEAHDPKVLQEIIKAIEGIIA